MTAFLVTTTHRHCKPGEPSGALYTVDLERRRVTSQCPVIEPPHRDADPNPRGGMRGAKGIAVRNDEVFVANASAVYCFDSAWNVTGSLSHPSCASIHDIAWRDGSLWVASCANDLLFQFDPAGRVLRFFNLRGYPAVNRALGWGPPNLLADEAVRSGTLDFRDPRTHRAEAYDTAHVNSFCFLPDGDLLVLLGLIWTRRWAAQLAIKGLFKRLGVWRPLTAVLGPLLRALPLKRAHRGDVGASLAAADAAVVRIGPDGGARVVYVLRGCRMPTHSLLARPDGTVLLGDTTAGEIVHLDPDRGTVLSRTKVTDEFLRGTWLLADDRVLVGSQRDVLLVDLRAGRVLDGIRLTDNPNSSVFDIKPLPPAFGPLPHRLARESGKALLACGG